MAKHRTPHTPPELYILLLAIVLGVVLVYFATQERADTNPTPRVEPVPALTTPKAPARTHSYCAP